MNNNVNLNIDSELLRQANAIFEAVGIDISTAIRMFLKKVIRDQSILFLINEKVVVNTPTKIDDPLPLQVAPDNITKTKAINLLRSKGCSLFYNVTFASKNRGVDNYWANPKLKLLNEDWSLILNDWKNRKIYLFNISAKSIAKTELVTRQDQPYKIDLQIMYEDPTFTDNRSGYSFSKYKVAEINY